MRQSPSDPSLPSADTPPLTISPDKVCWFIVKAREFDVKEGATDPDSGSNASDDGMVDVLESSANDPVEQELRSAIFGLTEDEKIDLVALAWLGRDDNMADDWPALREEAARAQANHANHTAGYLLGEPLLADFLEEGLSLLGYSCDET